MSNAQILYLFIASKNMNGRVGVDCTNLVSVHWVLLLVLNILADLRLSQTILGMSTSTAIGIAAARGWSTLHRLKYRERELPAHTPPSPRFCVCWANNLTCRFPPTGSRLILELRRAEVALRGPFHICCLILGSNQCCGSVTVYYESVNPDQRIPWTNEL